MELKPDYLPAVLNLAKLDIYEKNPQAAKARFETIIAAQPKNDGALVGLAQVLVLTGAPAKEVVATLERAISANQASVSARIALANFHLRNRDAKAALEVAQAAVAVSPNDPRLLDLLGSAQQATGDTNQALATFNKLASMRPGAPEPLLRLAAVHFVGQGLPGCNAGAQEGAEDQARLDRGAKGPRHRSVCCRQGRRRIRRGSRHPEGFPQGRYRACAGGGPLCLPEEVGARRERLSGSAQAPDRCRRSRCACIRCSRTTARSADATALASRWLKENPKDVVVRTYLGERALRNKDYKEATKYFKETVALQPENAVFLNNLAWTSNQLKDPAAIGYAEKAYALAPTSPNILDTYGWMLFQKGDVKRAVELLTEAAGRAPKAGEIRLHLAQALIESGDKAAARKELEAILQLGADVPQRAEAQALLAKL